MEKKVTNATYFKSAMDNMDAQRRNIENFIRICRENDMEFSPALTPEDADLLMRHVYRYLVNETKNIDILKMTDQDIEKLLAAAKQAVYDEKIEAMAIDMYSATHDNRNVGQNKKPIILVDELSHQQVERLVGLSRQITTAHPMQECGYMPLPVTPLGAPEGPEEMFNLNGRLIGNIHKPMTRYGDYESLVFETEDAVFVYCANKAVGRRLNEIGREDLEKRQQPIPQFSGRGGMMQAIANYKGITVHESFNEFLASNGKRREDAIDAVTKVLALCIERDLPFYACSLDTCFRSLDGTREGMHNHTQMMVPGDKITLKGVNENNFIMKPIGSDKAISFTQETSLPTEMTVLSVHENEHGSVVLTNKGAFVVGQIGESIVEQIHINEQRLQLAEQNIFAPDVKNGTQGPEDPEQGEPEQEGPILQ